MLRVFKVLEIDVGGTPPRTVVGEPGAFRFYTQPGLLHIGSVNAQSGSLPLTIEPVALEGGREYAVPYPLRPGRTEIQVQYDVTYDKLGTVFSEALIYPVEEMNVLVVPQTLDVVSELLADRGIDQQNGIRMFSGRDLPPGAPVVFRLSGEGTAASGGAQGGDGAAAPKVIRVPNPTQRLLVPTILGVFGALLLLMGFALTRRPAHAGPRARVASDEAALERREAILDRIVALDERHRTGEISEYAYWQKREALKAQLVEIAEETERRARPAPAGAGSGREP
jgi:hypothetical protein